jgi:hypothetical protein
MRGLLFCDQPTTSEPRSLWVAGKASMARSQMPSFRSKACRATSPIGSAPAAACACFRSAAAREERRARPSCSSPLQRHAEELLALSGWDVTRAWLRARRRHRDAVFRQLPWRVIERRARQNQRAEEVFLRASRRHWRLITPEPRDIAWWIKVERDRAPWERRWADHQCRQLGNDCRAAAGRSDGRFTIADCNESQRNCERGFAIVFPHGKKVGALIKAV